MTTVSGEDNSLRPSQAKRGRLSFREGRDNEGFHSQVLGLKGLGTGLKNYIACILFESQVFFTVES